MRGESSAVADVRFLGRPLGFDSDSTSVGVNCVEEEFRDFRGKIWRVVVPFLT